MGKVRGMRVMTVIVLRYADVLLMHAEAVMAGGAQTSDGSAIDSYMKVRERAGFRSGG